MPNLCEVELCTGCSACYSSCGRNAIEMKQDAEGFLRPSVNEGLCIDCGLCEKVCPILHPVAKHEQADAPIASLSKDVVIRKMSSSGGMFSIFAHEIFRRGGVVFGVVLDQEYNAYHTEAHNIEELVPMLGSKYMQSDLRDTFGSVKKYLTEGLDVLFTGTGCEIAGLRSYLRNTKQEKLITVDLVCHGAPSSKMFQSYLGKLCDFKGYGKCENFRFRELEGWGYAPSFEFAKGKRKLLSSEENLYMRLFLGGYLHRPSCYQCPYATQQRVSDITIADFWNIGGEAPFNYEHKHGVSLVLPNSDRGKLFYESVKDNVYDQPRTWSEALKVNHQLYRPSHRPRLREKAIDMILNASYDKTYRKFCDNRYLRMRHLVGNMLRFLHLR